MTQEGRKRAGHRHARLESIIFDIVSSLLGAEISDPRLEEAELTGVELSPDGRNLLVRYVHPDRAVAEAAMFGACRFSATLAERLGTKRVPEVRARFDEDIVAARQALGLLGDPACADDGDEVATCPRE